MKPEDIKCGDMKIIHKPLPTTGDTRIKRRFLFMPKRIEDETRWLEFATWQEIYYDHASLSGSIQGWIPSKWVENERRWRMSDDELQECHGRHAAKARVV